MSFKKLRKAQDEQGKLQSMYSIATPIPVIIREWYPAENKATIMISNESRFGRNTEIPGLKFPILGAAHVNMATNSILPGKTKALLYFAGSNIKKGYLVLAHEEGTDSTVTYAPVRYSWGVS